MACLRCLIPDRLSRTFLIALLLALLGFAVQPIEPVHAWALDCTDPANLTAMQIDQAQCESLESIYDNLGGGTWRNGNTGSGPGSWGEPTDVNTWYGVTRVGGNVTEISWSINYMSGNIHDINLTGLTGLEVFELGLNQIGGNIDGLNLTGLNNLEIIDLERNQIGGNIDGLDLSGVPNLQVLSLGSNQIGGSIDGLNLSGLSNLEALHLSGNQIGGSIDGLNLTGLTNLVDLHLSGNQIGGNIDGLNLTGLTNLLDLYLSGNQIGGSIDGLNLSGLTSLRYVLITNNQIGGNIDGLNLSGLTNLHHLYLVNNQIGGNIDGWNLSGLTDLHVVHMDYNQIGGNIDGLNLSGLFNLSVLHLGNNQIGGDIAGLDLTGLTGFNRLELHYNQITGDPSGMPYFPPMFRTFQVSHNQLNGTVPDLTAAGVLPNELYLCGGANVVAPSGNAAIDSYAEYRDASGWTATAGCPAPNLSAVAACNGNDLDVTLTTGDANFDVSADDPAAVNQLRHNIPLGGPYTLASSVGWGT